LDHAEQATRNLTDITLINKVENQFQAHKVILASQRPLDHAEKDTRNLTDVTLVRNGEDKIEAHEVIMASHNPLDLVRNTKISANEVIVLLK
jgi:hypothetical protein